MTADPARIVQKLWSYCHVLRDAGLSYSHYLEQLTTLLFLKMADERAEIEKMLGRDYDDPIPEKYRWAKLKKLEGNRLESHYKETLHELGKKPGLLGLIFFKAQNHIQEPAMLQRLIVELIDKEQWTGLASDVKGEAYEGLLEKNAQDTKSGAGQYFTPRSVIFSLIDCVKPKPGEVIADPACGTGGFLLAAYDYVAGNYKLNKTQKNHLDHEALRGVELVDSVTRLCAMNLFLRGIRPKVVDAAAKKSKVGILLRTDDALRDDPEEKVDLVVTNPPFGKKSSITVINEKGEEQKRTLTYERDSFWTTTSNKQLNFVQHVFSMLKINGRAAVVVPDNVLFEGGAGETVREELMDRADVHTLLRLPTGIFYAQGVKANVVFFTKKAGRAEPWTKKLWIYDLRTNKHFTLKQSPLKRSDLNEFVELYTAKVRKPTWSEENPDGRWRSYDYEEIINRDKKSLDIFWLRDESLEDSANLPDPHILANEIADDLRSALEQIEDILGDLEERVSVE